MFPYASGWLAVLLALSLTPIQQSASATVGAGGAIAFVSSTSADNGSGSGRLSINRPSGIVPGFSMLASIVVEDPTSLEPPAGWSLMRADGVANLYYHLAD